MIAILNVFFVLNSLFVPMLRFQLIYTDNVPFAFKSFSLLKDYYSPNLPNSTSVDYSSMNFQSTPQIIIGINVYNNKGQTDKIISFQVSSSNASQTSCQINVDYDSTSILYGLSVSVLVIDSTQFPYFQLTQVQKLNVFQGSSSYVYQETIQFSSNIINAQGVKNVFAILTGWRSEIYQTGNTRFTLKLTAQVLDSSSFQITITSDPSSETITNVYYTIVEFVSEPLHSIFGIASNTDTQYQNPGTGSAFYLGFNGSKRYFPVGFNVPSISNLSFPQSNYQFFAFINQFDIATTNLDQDLRIKLINFSFNTTSLLSYQYYIWDGSCSFGAISSSMFFYKKSCQQANQKILRHTCVTDCIHISTVQPLICIDCQTGEYFLQDKQTCQTTTPLSYYCSTEKDYQACQPCQINQCLQCSLNNSLFYCTKCSSNYYLYNGQCYQQQPDNTYCDNNFSCSTCSDPLCKTCQTPATQPQLCSVCLANNYLLQNQCSTTKPSNVYCDGYNCIPCPSYCVLCSMNNSQLICTQCQQNYYLYSGQCYQQQPDNTYCDANYLCFQCSDSLCKTCLTSATQPQQCQICFTNNYILQNQCSATQPSNAYCNGYNCIPCPSQCVLCSMNNNLLICTQCSQNYYLYNGQCYQQQPDNTYCNENLICSQCSDSLCRTCQTPAVQPQLCSVCFANNYILQNQCSTTKPVKSYCDGFNCVECPSQCVLCSMNNSLLICTQCNLNYYLYNGQCYQKQPDNTYCDQNSNCSQCSDPLCKTCLTSATQPQQCSICFANNYILQNQCSTIKPNGAYCDGYNCIECPNQCIQCSMNNNSLSCVQCSQNYFLYNGQCYQQQPDNTFCDNSLICSQCQDSQCKTCQTPAVQPQLCSVCFTNYYLYQNQCSINKPVGAYCDGQNCITCSSQCIQCSMNSNQLICIQCSQNYYLYNGICYEQQPENTFCDENSICTQCSDPLCKTCLLSTNQPELCSICFANNYILSNQCSATKPDGTYCDGYNCVKCPNKTCQTCLDPSISSTTCSICYDSDYYFEGQCYSATSLPTNTFCDTNLKNCFKCQDSTCKTCSDTRINTQYCISCSNDYILSTSSGKCIEETAQLKTTQQATKGAIAVSLIPTSVNAVQVFFTLQKLNYIVMIDIDYPKELITFIEAIKGTSPIDTLQSINIFSKYLFIEQKDDLDSQIITKKIGQTSINQNGGGVVVLIIIAIIIFVPVFIATKYSEQSIFLVSQGYPLIPNKYSNLIVIISCMIFFQVNEIIIIISNFAMFLQIIGFAYIPYVNYKGFKIVSVITLVLYQSTIVILYYKILNQIKNFLLKKRADQIHTYNNNLYKLITNDTKDDLFLARNFKIVFLIIEHILIPFSIVIFYYDYKLQTLLSFSFQFILCLMSIILRPSKILVENVRLILDQVSWIITFILIFVLGKHTEKGQDTGEQQSQTVSILSYIIQILLYFILYLNPFISIIKIILLIVEIIKNFLQRKNQLNSARKNLKSESSLYNTRNNTNEYLSQSFQPNLKKNFIYQSTRLDHIFQNKKQTITKGSHQSKPI